MHSRYCLSIATLIVGVACLLSYCPKSSLAVGDKVEQLVSFFTILNNDFKAYQMIQKDRLEVVPALTKMFELINEEPVKYKCDKYIKLIKTPIKIESIITSIAEEERVGTEVINLDANLMEGLYSEKKYDAISRILAVLHTLTEETWKSKSLLHINLQDELLSCVSYFIYRHQSALTNLADYVKHYKNSLRPNLEKPRSNNQIENEMTKVIDKISRLESENENLDFDMWIAEMEKLAELVIDARFILSDRVREFLSSRLKNLNKQEENAKRWLELKGEILALEELHKTNPQQVAQDDYEVLTNSLSFIQETPGPYSNQIKAFLASPQRIDFGTGSSMNIEGYKNEIREMEQAQERQKRLDEEARVRALAEKKKSKNIFSSVFKSRKSDN